MTKQRMNTKERKDGKAGGTRAKTILRKTDRAERPARTGKTGATGILRETGRNGMPEGKKKGGPLSRPALWRPATRSKNSGFP